VTDTTISAFTCPPRCGAGGPAADDGHLFNKSMDFYECLECGEFFAVPEREKPKHPYCEPKAIRMTGGSLVCSGCGLSAMDRDLMRLP
jgi:hypothetical protein